MAEPKTPVPEEKVETPEEEVAPEETPEEAPKEETPEEPQPEEAPEEPAPEEEPEPAPPSRRETLRIQQILEKRRQEEAPKIETVGGIDYKTALDAEPEVVAALEADRTKVAQQQYQAGLQQAEAIKWETRLEVDAPRIEAKYPQLDKNSSEFHPAVADALNKAYLNAVGFDPQNRTVQNPSLRYSEYIEGMMELAEEIAGEKVTKTTQSITKQAARTGLRPDGSAAKRLNLNKSPETMTDEELAAVLAQAGL